MFYTERTYHITAQKERDVTMIYPSGLITAKVINPDSWGTDPGPVTIPRLLRYTKHYYIGTERISSVTDTKSNLGHFIENLSYNDFFPVSTLRAMSNAQVEAAGEALEETYDHFGLEYSVPAPVVEGSKPTPGYTDFNNASIGRYFFHPDHLGSSSYITDKAGVVSQHMEYLPFGELLVDEHLNSHNSPFKFNAKELDPETGNYYYGARYYNPKWSIWLSVDKEYWRYPHYSPYNYTLQNPVRYIDPDGNSPCPPGVNCENVLANMERIRVNRASNLGAGDVRIGSDGRAKWHGGHDLYAPTGTEVRSSMAGTVEATGYSSSYGNYITIKTTHTENVPTGEYITRADGTILPITEEKTSTYYTFFAHLESIGVEVGASVTAGQNIGTTGTTGNAAGLTGDNEHLHFEIGTELRSSNSPFLKKSSLLDANTAYKDVKFTSQDPNARVQNNKGIIKTTTDANGNQTHIFQNYNNPSSNGTDIQWRIPMSLPNID